MATMPDRRGQRPRLLGRPAMLQAQRDQVGDIRFAGTHHRVRATPINLHGSIRLGNRAAALALWQDLNAPLTDLEKVANLYQASGAASARR